MCGHGVDGTPDGRKQDAPMFREVPVLPVVVPLAAAILVAQLAYLRHRARLTAPRAAIALVLCVYAAGVVANTVFPIFLDAPASSAPWSSHLNLVPLEGYEAVDALVNIAVFAPLGALAPWFTAKASWWRVVAAAAVFSLVIEGTQLVTAHLLAGGHVADVNDLFFNVVGAALGLGLVRASSSLLPQTSKNNQA
jgi:glycopeptide antibiotics resistance protein